MTKGKFGFDKIKQEAESLLENIDATNFVKSANNGFVAKEPNQIEKKKEIVRTEADKIEPEKKPAAKTKVNSKKLVVEGLLKDRQNNSAPMHIYIKNELTEWINQHAAGGRGGQQIVINYLIRQGIEKVEKEYKKSGIIFAEE